MNNLTTDERDRTSGSDDDDLTDEAYIERRQAADAADKAYWDRLRELKAMPGYQCIDEHPIIFD